MRRFLFALLLSTSVALPALAQDSVADERGSEAASSEQRVEARAARRAQRAQQFERVGRERFEQVDSGNRAARIEARRGSSPQVSGEPFQWGQRRSNDDRPAAATESAQPQRGGGLREQRRDRRNRDHSVINQVIEHSRTSESGVVVNRGQEARPRSLEAHSRGQWGSHWRRDRNHDWRNHRDRNRSIYRLGTYWDPYGSRYRRFSIGFSLFPSYYRSSYWLNDPWTYRLPPAYGQYRWVRYYNDALLVDLYTGQVVDVEYNFFW